MEVSLLREGGKSSWQASGGRAAATRAPARPRTGGAPGGSVREASGSGFPRRSRSLPIGEIEPPRGFCADSGGGGACLGVSLTPSLSLKIKK